MPTPAAVEVDDANEASELRRDVTVDGAGGGGAASCCCCKWRCWILRKKDGKEVDTVVAAAVAEAASPAASVGAGATASAGASGATHAAV